MNALQVSALELSAVLAGERALRLESNSPAETCGLAALLAGLAAPGEVILLVGNLGSGKTTFVQGFCAALGVPVKATSPTFTLMHIYQGGRWPIYHFDFYRMHTTAEIAALGLEEYWEGRGISLIEWPQLAWPLLPDKPLAVRFEMPDFASQPERRLIVIERATREEQAR
ncbi:MAG: tRNA (adenosine(37)-N6)-threonylcarbamoyltransferase complex ATPase subunit type 1 TsaE [candidate division KSB1 bacterium]|nr:tRNA (adenosine(37)-N6)-threonylcarbamoyltransferase complex ATPase subunit type 1 TsaE [candidate division KSB1 bacterium]MDZ7275193.1 tRNA (adenosine(37)-N6)-threonylcarbamoyltransferase complex ATPase subunit type 1 TsaE [candidate division KSB1 bacterium]MDZ7287362.1 tRNA (adenosine(37)-N6)-threonylcarbamoyltransferase complex ATPase subunit type 1 TsaE [candidate division KSB1 bacterium]MDZ7299476.1 tRNA (adenosine(37)-N6)-threonylcarbamoyltransferase complex ATPase subunit type 1 TsaE [